LSENCALIVFMWKVIPHSWTSHYFESQCIWGSSNNESDSGPWVLTDSLLAIWWPYLQHLQAAIVFISAWISTKITKTHLSVIYFKSAINCGMSVKVAYISGSSSQCACAVLSANLMKWNCFYGSHCQLFGIDNRIYLQESQNILFTQKLTVSSHAVCMCNGSQAHILLPAEQKVQWCVDKPIDG